MKSSYVHHGTHEKLLPEKLKEYLEKTQNCFFGGQVLADGVNEMQANLITKKYEKFALGI